MSTATQRPDPRADQGFAAPPLRISTPENSPELPHTEQPSGSSLDPTSAIRGLRAAGVTTSTSPKSTSSASWARRTWVKLLAIAAITLVAGGSGWWLMREGPAAVPADLLLHTVTRGDLKISVIERGNLESQNELEVLCEVDDVRRDGINGTPIVWIIPNGSRVKQGDLLVELDSAPIREQLDEQVLDTEQAREAAILAEARYENQLTQNETNRDEAELRVELSKLELKMFADEQNGTHKLEVEEIKRAIDDINNEILAAQANLELRRNDKEGIETLFNLGYAGKSELDRSRLDFLQAEGQYAAKINRLRTQLATLSKKETYERQMQEMQLQGQLETAERGLQQVLRNNEAALAQAKASLESKRELLAKEEELLGRYQDQLDKCKILAPQDGMVAYTVSRSEPIRAGAPVRLRQHILSIPNLTRMQVKTAVHESVLDMIDQDLKATIRVDAFSDRTYSGTVHSVAVLPDQSGWVSSDTKVYETVILIDEEVDQIKPGMTAVVEIHIDHLRDVLTLPLQAVLQEEGVTFCFVSTPKGLERRVIQVGRANDHAVHLLQGVEEGEQVVLNPMSLEESLRNGNDEEEDSADTKPAETSPAGTDPAEASPVTISPVKAGPLESGREIAGARSNLARQPQPLRTAAAAGTIAAQAQSAFNT